MADFANPWYSRPLSASARSAGSQQLTSPRKLSPLGLQFIRLRSFLSDGKTAIAEFAKQMLHMPGVVYSRPRLAADASQMAKADDDSHFASVYDSSWRSPRLSRAALRIPISIASVKSKPLIDERPRRFRCALAIFELGVRAVHISSTTSKTPWSLPCAICKSTMNKASEFII